MTSLSFKIGSFSACAVLTMSIATGCSSSSSPANTSGGGGGGTGGHGGGGGGSGVCAQIPQADVQALTVPTIVHVFDLGGPLAADGCTFTPNSAATISSAPGSDPGAIVVNYGPDADKSAYNLQHTSTSHAISGIGDEAFWSDGISFVDGPELDAHQGDVTCFIVSSTPPNTTMKTTPTDADASTGGYTVTDADALAYVQLMGKVCNDVFAASK